MIEYHAHTAGVDVTQRTLIAIAGAGPVFPPGADELAAVIEDNRSAARLGALVDALVRHATSDIELRLLRKAADLWSRAVALYEELKTARSEFGRALLRDDLDDPVAIAQMGLERLIRVQATARALEVEVGAFRGELAAMPHLPKHPRQADTASSAWSIDDAFPARRSLAFVAAMLTHATDDRGRALAAGALAGYAGNVAGSAYLGHTVGGPRRLHRFRDRLARNTLGAWVHDTMGTPGLSELANELREGLTNPENRETMVPELAAQITAAFADAYPARSAPDIAVGFRRMLEHLDLLDGFAMPGLPESPPLVPSAGGEAMTIDASSMPGQIQPQDFEGGVPPGSTMGPETDTGGSTPGKSSSKDGSCDALMILAAFIVAVLVYTIWCIVRATEDKDCDPGDLWRDIVGEDDTVEVETEFDETRLAIMKKPERANHLFQDIYALQIHIWQVLEAARQALIANGLIYPRALDLPTKLHQQFLVAFAAAQWPRSETAETEANFERYPMSAEELPSAPSPFPNAGPDVLFGVDLENQDGTISAVVVDAFLSLKDAAGVETHQNLDLDADRGWRHPAWAVAAGSSITAVPLNIEILPFASE